MITRVLFACALLCVNCGGSSPPDPAPGDSAAGSPDRMDTVAGSFDTADAGPIDLAQRHFDALPDSMRVRRGACPFECCVYGEWRAVTAIPLHSAPDPAAPRAGSLRPGETFTADSGEVHILGPAVVVVHDTVQVRPGVRLVPGDTVVVLDYVGEGVWNLAHRGRVLEEVAGFWGAEFDGPKGAYYGDYRKAWWVHARGAAQGWFRADSTFEYSGADACG